MGDCMEKAEADDRRFAGLAVAITDQDEHRIATFRQAAAHACVRNIVSYGTAKATVAAIRMFGPPDILFVRLQPDSGDGFALCRAIRSPGSFPHPYMPLVAVCKDATQRCVRAARDAGFDEFLLCPYSPRTLRERLTAILDDRRGFVRVSGYFGPDRRRGAMAQWLGAERRSAPTLMTDPRTERTYMG